jgi:two-component system response regulator AtoC
MARILIAEDERNMRKVLLAHLRPDGHRIYEAGTLHEALELMGGHDFDVVLLDQKLPDGDGMAVLDEAKRNGSAASVVVLTAFGTVELAV